ncbi:MAG: hypothetical protein NTY37_02005 [Methanothrix sp.]|nr:hypothetical protein [Methanothrix sp.]
MREVLLESREDRQHVYQTLSRSEKAAHASSVLCAPAPAKQARGRT